MASVQRDDHTRDLKGLVAAFDRHHRFRLARQLNAHGFFAYQLENAPQRERLDIPRALFDRFRAAIRRAMQIDDTEQPLQVDVRFLGEPCFSVLTDKRDPDCLVIRAFGEHAATMTVKRTALPTLDGLLFHRHLQHPNELLDRIVTYHKLFQFSFVEGSESLTSNLILRRDVLAQVDRYLPALGQRAEVEQAVAHKPIPQLDAPPPSKKSRAALFKSRLAERDGERDYQVNYESLFSAEGSGRTAKTPRTADDQSEGAADGPLHSFALPLLASDVRAYGRPPWRCLFSGEEIKRLRHSFLGDRDAEFYLGFEILDCIFRRGGQLKTFRFPLYYLPVALEESGRELVIHPSEGLRVYLNHLALANLVESFSSQTDALQELFTALLNQTFAVRGETDHIALLRWLPFEDEVYDRTREILLGYPGENGKGGLLADLEVNGIECDRENVRLYRTPKPTSPALAALEQDLDHIVRTARATPERFYESLLGRFLSPEASAGSTGLFSETLWMPGAQPRSIRTLLNRLNSHDLVLLEGPPGTGKTYTIANLLIHCLATGKRLLVVSDKQGAIGALWERLQDYLLAGRRQTPEGQELDLLSRLGIKVIDEIPAWNTGLDAWVRQVRRMLQVDDARELDWPEPDPIYVARVERADRRMAEVMAAIDRQVGGALGLHQASRAERVAERDQQPGPGDDLREVFGLAQRLQRDKELRGTVRQFVADREALAELTNQACYDLFALTGDPLVRSQEFSALAADFLRFQKQKPRSAQELEQALTGFGQPALAEFATSRWHQTFPAKANWLRRLGRRLRSLWRYPLVKEWRAIQRLIENQRHLFASAPHLDDVTWSTLQALHDSLHPAATEPPDLAIELALAVARPATGPSVQEQLEELARLQEERDAAVRQQFLGGLGKIASGAAAARRQGTNRLTTILAQLDSLEAFSTLGRGAAVLGDLQRLLVDTFPVWICRKQAVPFLFPTTELSFDLVIVDEATQCRVDDALPLLYRARKLMAVGDERQTGLAKNSVIDDYLFNAFDLDEHLRLAQARSIKGGGSHLFGLVKRIKQASVMLVEHYRCPPAIISFSNRYVYDGQLRVMQWTMPGAPPAVVVNHAEANETDSERQRSGKYKGIETAMVDRFLAYVQKTVKAIERETGERINTDTDLALCYFLLKNEPYVKAVKGDFLSGLARGTDVLDGAGAALQGKERPYIFYLWDVTRYNMQAFRQGDDDSKRRGELNVLMSRPKRRAYHYLHRDFAQLKHHTCTITDYLWGTLRTQGGNGPVPEEIADGSPSSGHLIKVVVGHVLGPSAPQPVDCQLGVTVGDPARVVDLMWLPPAAERHSGHSLGVVELSGFAGSRRPGEDVVDYYFQLKRASPTIEPVFGFLRELIDPDAYLWRRLRRR